MGPRKSHRLQYDTPSDPLALAPPTCPTALDSLPTEILLKIFEILAEDETGRRSLKVAASVSRQWRALTQVVLLGDTAASGLRGIRGKPVESSKATSSDDKQCGSTTAGAVVEESKSVEGFEISSRPGAAAHPSDSVDNSDGDVAEPPTSAGAMSPIQHSGRQTVGRLMGLPLPQYTHAHLNQVLVPQPMPPPAPPSQPFQFWRNLLRWT